MGIFSLIWNWFVLVLIVAAAVFFAAGLWKLRRQPQAVPFAFSPGSLPGDFFRGVEVVGAMVANPAQMTSCRAVCRRRMQGGWGV